MAMFRRSSLVVISVGNVGNRPQQKTRPALRRASSSQKSDARLRGLLNARRGGAFGPFLGLVADLGTLGQGLEALAEDRAVMDEDVLRAIVGCDEPVALVVAEPLDCSSGHALPPLHCAANAEDAVKQRRER